MSAGDSFICGCWCGCARRSWAQDAPICACDDTPRCDDCHLSNHCTEGAAA